MQELGSTMLITLQTSKHEYWQQEHDCPDIQIASKRMEKQPKEAEWVVTINMLEYESESKNNAMESIVNEAW